MMFQKIAPRSPPRMTCGSTMLCSIIPPPTALATATLPVNNAVKLNVAAQNTAASGLRTRVPTIVAMEFAESWKPLLKSKMKAIATIATTYQTTGSGVLDGDAVHGVGDAHAQIDRDLERLVYLLPPDHLERIGAPGEQGPDRVVIDRVPFLLQLLDLGRLRAHQCRHLDGFHRCRDVLGRLTDHRRHLLRRLAHFVDVQHDDAPRRSIEPIDHVIQSRREEMDVLPVDRRDEALVDPGVDREGQDVRLMLDILDLLHEVRRPPRIGEELTQECRRRLEMLRQLVEQVEELLVARDQTVQHAVLVRVESPSKLPERYGTGKCDHQLTVVLGCSIWRISSRRATRRRFSNSLINTTPARNPPTCAHTATPPETSGRIGESCGRPVRTWRKNHQSSTSHAGMAITLKKMMKMNSMFTRTRGYSTRYAPIPPEIAPDAPTVGTGDAGATRMCAPAATSPHTR